MHLVQIFSMKQVRWMSEQALEDTENRELNSGSLWQQIK